MKSVSSNTFDYEPRKSDWYNKAKEEGKQIWVGTDVDPLDHLLGITVAQPVFNKKDGLKGVFTLGIKLNFLSFAVTIF